MTPGSNRLRHVRRGANRIAISATIIALTTIISGCSGGRIPSRPLPPLEAARATPEPTPTPDPAPLSLAPPAPRDSLPPHPPAHLATAARIAERASAELDEQRLDRAIELLEQAVQVDPSAPFAYYYMAEAYLRRSRAEEALVFAQRAATLSHGYPLGWESHSHVLRGRALETLGRTDQAAAAYHRALELDPRNVPAKEGLEKLR